jgi:hypothetical protein
MPHPDRTDGADATVVIPAAHTYFVRQALQTVAATDICEPDLPTSIEQLDVWLSTLLRLRMNLAQLSPDADDVQFTESRELPHRVADALTLYETAEDPDRFPDDAAAAALARAIGQELRRELGMTA